MYNAHRILFTAYSRFPSKSPSIYCNFLHFLCNTSHEPFSFSFSLQNHDISFLIPARWQFKSKTPSRHGGKWHHIISIQHDFFFFPRPFLGCFASRSHEATPYTTLRDSDKGPLYIIKVFVLKGQRRHNTIHSGVNLKGNCLKMSILGYMARRDIFYSASGSISIVRIDDNIRTESQCFTK